MTGPVDIIREALMRGLAYRDLRDAALAALTEVEHQLAVQKNRADGEWEARVAAETALAEAREAARVHARDAFGWQDKAEAAERRANDLANALRALLADDDMPHHWTDCVCSYCVKHIDRHRKGVVV